MTFPYQVKRLLDQRLIVESLSGDARNSVLVASTAGIYVQGFFLYLTCQMPKLPYLLKILLFIQILFMEFWAILSSFWVKMAKI